MKLKNFLRVLSLTIFIAFVSTYLLFILIRFNVKMDILNTQIPQSNQIIDSLKIHFIHGSTPMKNCKDYPEARLGRKLGGHVEIQVEKDVFGFNYSDKKIHYFNSNNFNSTYESRIEKDWKIDRKHDKITTIPFPITKDQKKLLLEKMNNYHCQPPYDYAFFGQRCTSSAAEILSDCKIFGKYSNFESVCAFFYPRELRFLMLKLAKKNNIEPVLKGGISCHKWE